MDRKGRLRWVVRASALGVLGASLALTTCCTSVKRGLVGAFTPEYTPSGDPSQLRAEFPDKDASRARIPVMLTKVGSGFLQPTDLQFPPGQPGLMVVLEKDGIAKWLSLADGKGGTLLEQEVLTESEEGLLGIAFHPRFAENGRFFLDYVLAVNGSDTTRIEEWTVPPGADLRTAKPRRGRTLLEVKQPYQNHKGGQLQFGPDGALYIGLGDGGFRDDPENRAQNPGELLGKLLRLDVEREGAKPEVWATGLRNPWRFSFDATGRLIAADVGQDKWEELDVLERGGNYGWTMREGRHCHKPEESCPTAGFTEPFYEYGHDEGQSITGGYVYEGKRIPALAGKYVFGDFVSGRLWAIDAPAKNAPGAALAVPSTLGKWPILVSTFGRGPDGELYLADFGSGTIYALQP